ncbi:hypothetical protein M569_02494, partial [Genlisea aurea]
LPKKKKKQKKDDDIALLDLAVLGEELLTSRLHVNNLVVLLEFISPKSQPHYLLESLLSLQSFFTPLRSQLSRSKCSSSADSDPETVYRTWLRSKFDEFVRCLIGVAVSSESLDDIKEVVLGTIMDFVKEGNAGKFHSNIYHKLLIAMVHSALGNGDALLDLLASKYFTYVDVRYFTYISLEKLTRTLEGKGKSSFHKEHCIRKIYQLLSNVPPLDLEENIKTWSALGLFSSKDENTDLENDPSNYDKSSTDKVLLPKKIIKKMKLKFSKAWISFLRLELPVDVYKEVLATLHEAVIPYLSNPTVLCDFLTQSYDIGGVVSVMALSSLFILMTENGLEYPNFYTKLYGLLEPSIFLAKHRSRFFQLLDSCLKSPLLPAYLAAAFCKKLSRLVLFAPPSGALVITALVHNLLQRHPSIYFLVHQEEINLDSSVKSNSGNGIRGVDLFRYEEDDPKKSNAMRSSLWEMDTLRHHYCPAVSRFAISLENDLSSKSKAAEVAVKDFSSGSYATIFNDEMRRRVKQVPLAFYNEMPSALFSESDFPGWKFEF